MLGVLLRRLLEELQCVVSDEMGVSSALGKDRGKQPSALSSFIALPQVSCQRGGAQPFPAVKVGKVAARVVH